MKFKVITLPYYYSFEWCSWAHNLSSDDNILNYFESLKDEWENPLYYLEPAENVNFSPREKIGYCVRKESRGEKKYTSYYDNNCLLYCWQLGRWWKTKHYINLFRELHIPKISREDYNKIPRSAISFFDKKYLADVHFYEREKAYQDARRETKILLNRKD